MLSPEQQKNAWLIGAIVYFLFGLAGIVSLRNADTMLVLFIAGCFLFSIACFVMWRYNISKESAPPRIFERAPAKAQEALIPSRLMNSERRMQKIEVPDYFDEQRISQDLAKLADSPGVFAKYIERARSRFTKSSQKAILEHYITLYQTGKRVVDARTDLERSKSTYKQLEYEDEIKRTEKEARLAALDAEKEEHLLRKERAAHERKNIGADLTGTPQKNEDEEKMEAAQRRARLDIRHTVELKAGEKFYTLAEWQRWRKEKRREVRNNAELSEDEKDELLDQIEDIYHDQMKNLKAGVDIYEER